MISIGLTEEDRMRRFLLSICLLAVSTVSGWAQTITVTQPSAGAVWKKGETRMIQWTKQGDTGANVKIVLRKTGQTAAVLEIADPAPNSGSFPWTIPASVPEGTYFIRVRSKTNTQVTDDSGEFQIKDKEGAAIPLLFAVITEPKADTVWKQSQTQMIKWTKYSHQAVNVRVLLMDPAVSNTVRVISSSTPNSGSFSWNIPDSIANGSYRIRIASTSSDAHADSGTFRITKMFISESTTRGAINQGGLGIEVTAPAAGTQYKLGNPINVSWVTKLSSPFVYELVSEDGKTKILEFGDWEPTVTGPDTYSEALGTAFGTNPYVATNWYRIRVRHGVASGLSGKIHIARPTEEVLLQFQPTIRDRHSRRLIDTDQDWQPDNWWEASKPGLARAGCDFRYIQTNQSWVGFIFRTQLTFPIEQVDMTGKTLKEAWVYIEEKDQKDGYDGYQPAPQPYATIPTARGKTVYALTGPWDGKCIDTPGYAVGEIPWSADTHIVQLTDVVRGWLDRSKPNHGLIIGSRFEPFLDWSCYFAISWYKATLNIRVIQEK
jgi:hypothetical protein